MSKRFSTDKEINSIVRKLLRSEWSYKQGRKHGRLLHSDGKRSLTISCTPSDKNAARGLLRDLKKIEAKAWI